MLYNWEPTELEGLQASTKLNTLHTLMDYAAYDNDNFLSHVELNITAVNAFLDRLARRELRVHELEAGFRTIFAPWGKRLGGRIIYTENTVVEVCVYQWRRLASYCGFRSHCNAVDHQHRLQVYQTAQSSHNDIQETWPELSRHCDETYYVGLSVIERNKQYGNIGML